MELESRMEAIQRLKDRGHWGIKAGLENIRAMLETLGHPETACPVILIGGTNGKGSTGAFLESILRTTGFRTGWATSPHLVSPAERIRLDGESLEESHLDELLKLVFQAEDQLGLQATYFELMIAATFLAFREAQPDLALVEVGMGGRWDSTNASDPILSILTNVGLEHTQFLGETREAIAREKLCIARSGRPLVLGPTLDPLWCEPLLECQPILRSAPWIEGARIFWDHSEVDGHLVGLAGAHQLENLATALIAVDVLLEQGWTISPQAIWEGVASVRWPGRLWPVPGFPGLWMDGAHNPDGARVLADHAIRTGVRPHLLFGAMKDKDLVGVFSELRRMDPRSISFLRGEDERYARFEQLEEAWDMAAQGIRLPIQRLELRSQKWPSSFASPRLLTGSLFLIGDVLRLIRIQI